MRVEAQREVIAEVVDILEKHNNIKIIKKGDSYITIERDNHFLYFQIDSIGCMGVSASLKISPYEEVQCNYFENYVTWNYAINYLTDFIPSTRALGGCHNKRLFLCELYGMRPSDKKTTLNILKQEIAGFREKEILNNLEHIIVCQKDEKYNVLEFIGKDKDSFKFECNAKTIVG